MADDELEDFWADIRRTDQAIVEVRNEPSNFKGQLLLASETTKYDMLAKFLGGRKELTSEFLTEIISTTIDTALKRWYDGIRQHDLAGLIEIVLEGQQHRMTPEELTGFIHALPLSLLTRILDTAVDASSGTGVHMLLALEKNRRSIGTRYSLRSAGGSIVVTWVSPQGEIEFNLYEKYDLDKPNIHE